jgi:peptidoglycan hydrolase-like protein with peptidoglycan-binding domain
MAGKARSGGLAIAVAIALIAPLAAGIVLVLTKSNESPLESAAAVEPLVGSVERAERYNEASVAIAVKYATALAPATQASGTLTALKLAPGTDVKTGTVVGSVNNQKLVAYASKAPLFQDIYRGLKGTDVKTAQQLLTDLGFYIGAIDGDAGPATEKSIKAFNAAHGWGKDNGTLALASLVWVGQAPVTVSVSEVSVTLGSSVSPGTELFKTTAALAAITVTETPSLPTEGAVTLTVNGVTVPYEVGSGAVTEPDAVAQVAATMGTTTEGVGTVALVEPLVVGTVPSSAVFSDETGGTCIFPDVTGAAIAVTPTGGTLGTVDLDESLVGQAVLINPRDVREDLTCG